MAPTAERIPDEDWNKKFQILIPIENLRLDSNIE